MGKIDRVSACYENLVSYIINNGSKWKLNEEKKENISSSAI